MDCSPVESRLYYFNDVPTKLGHIGAVSTIRHGGGTDRNGLRVYGRYALVLILEGTGQYDDANGRRQCLVPGDFILVTPDLPHRYCTRPGRYWTECHVIFEGAVFDLCRTQGILNPERPICHREPVELWFNRMLGLVLDPVSRAPVEKAAEVTRLLALLMETFGEQDAPATVDGPAMWLSEAKAMLEANLDAVIEPKGVALELGVSYETFRKGFRHAFGVSPHRFRTERRIAVACRLLEMTSMTHRRIAAHLGFPDEFHFSKRFKQIVGVSPREYRAGGEARRL